MTAAGRRCLEAVAPWMVLRADGVYLQRCSSAAVATQLFPAGVPSDAAPPLVSSSISPEELSLEEVMCRGTFPLQVLLIKA